MDRKSSAPKFWVHAKRKHSTDHLASLYVKIVFDSQSHERSMGIRCPFDKWRKDKTLISGFPVETHQLKKDLEELKQKIMGAYYLLKQQDSFFSLSEILEVAEGDRKPGALSFFQTFFDYIERMQRSAGEEGYSSTNIQKHKRCFSHIKNFVEQHYHSADLSFSKITKTTVEELFYYLKTGGKCEHNSALKYMQIFKKIYQIGADNGWIKQNAFAGFKFRIRVKERTYLSEQEVVVLQHKQFNNKRLDQVKDLFVFSCFTGLAYSDVKNLVRSNIINQGNGFWIKCNRTKTKVAASIPLLPPALVILNKISPGWEDFHAKSNLLDIISNQKVNAYLKEIAHICNIDKELTFHLARHTFATTITLSNGVPIETVSKMLGHTRISMTQHYSKVVDMKIAKDTEELYKRFRK